MPLKEAENDAQGGLHAAVQICISYTSKGLINSVRPARPVHMKGVYHITFCDLVSRYQTFARVWYQDL